MPSRSHPSELDEVLQELDILAVKQKQLRDRKAVLEMLENFKHKDSVPAIIYNLQTNRRNSRIKEVSQSELDQIREELEELEEREMELLKLKDALLSPPAKENNVPTEVAVFPMDPDLQISPPPPYRAPEIIMDVKQLPAEASCTICPACQQYIITEIVPKVGTVTWLVCIMSAMIGCVVGCCFVPFCVDNFKDIEHKCPKCRTKLHTIRKL